MKNLLIPLALATIALSTAPAFTPAPPPVAVQTTIQVEGHGLPLRLHGLEWTGLTNYAAQNNNPALGVGIGYHGADFKVDIYVYDALEAQWSHLPVQEKISREKAMIPDIFHQMTDRGYYSGVKIVKNDTVTLGTRRFEHVEINFHDNRDGDLNSHYYLSDLNGKVLKIRISRALSTPPATVDSVLTEIVQSLDGPAGKPAPAR